MRIKRLILTIIVFFFLCSASYAACSWSGNTGTVASLYAAADINACISDASALTGEVIIQIPDGTPTHSATVTVDMSTGFTNVTSLTIRGENDCTLDGDGRPTACGTNITSPAFVYTGEEGKAFRLAHMRLTGDVAGGTAIYVAGDCKSWRFDHIFFDTITSAMVIRVRRVAYTDNITYGVVDHCNIQNTEYTFLAYTPADGGNLEWMNPLGLGTADALYLEDSTLYNTTYTATNVVTGGNGPGKFVIRYNDIHNAYIQSHDAIVVGYRGVRKWEIYNNAFTYSGSCCFVGHLRSGTGVFFNNTISDPGEQLCSPYIVFSLYRTEIEGGDPWDELCDGNAGKAILDTSTNYPQDCESGDGCIDIDGAGDGDPLPAGYPCRDQLGFDENDPQTTKPFLLWNNTKNDNNNVSPGVSYGETYIVADRDYCVAEDWVTMPATCNGVTTTYVPYTYPHPLRGESIISGCTISGGAIH